MKDKNTTPKPAFDPTEWESFKCPYCDGHGFCEICGSMGKLYRRKEIGPAADQSPVVTDQQVLYAKLTGIVHAYLDQDYLIKELESSRVKVHDLVQDLDEFIFVHCTETINYSKLLIEIDGTNYLCNFFINDLDELQIDEITAINPMKGNEMPEHKYTIAAYPLMENGKFVGYVYRNGFTIWTSAHLDTFNAALEAAAAERNARIATDAAVKQDGSDD